MSDNNGVVRIGRKGRKKFAFGDGEPFEVDVVVAFQEWVGIDGSFRDKVEDGCGSSVGDRTIPPSEMFAYHQAAVVFVKSLMPPPLNIEITVAEALDFIARLREQYDEVADFFQPKSRRERDSPGTSGSEIRFSVEPE